MKLSLRLLSAFIVFAVMTCGARAAEVIRAYNADIVVEADASLVVTEEITVTVEHDQIKRGIFRDFPLYAQAADGHQQEVDFDLLEVKRDGNAEPYHTESIAGGIRIYIGSADVLLEPGEHTYTIVYKTGRQIRYFDDQDELYWNVTGNGWTFPIEYASATVTLPNDALPTKTTFYTGPVGAKGKDAREIEGSGGLQFETTEVLGPQEGLTIVVGLEKGLVAAPSADQNIWWWLRDNRAAIISFGGLLLVGIYYFRSWSAVGRDPAKGVVVPRWDAPDGISPALVNYIDNKGFSNSGWTALSATALELAVKGYVELDDLENGITIRRTKTQISEKLSTGQAVLMGEIQQAGQELVIDKANGKRVEEVGNKFRSAIEKEHRNKYYHSNIGYTLLGIGLSVAVLVALLAFGNLEENAYGLLLVPTIAAIVFGVFSVGLVNTLRARRSLFGKVFAIIGLAVGGFIAVSVLGILIVSMALDLQHSDQIPVLMAFGGVVLLNILFFFLMGAPTPLGQKLMEGIEGLRIYLTLAEKDRMNMAGAPTMSPSHFEKLLPFAVAMGVEKPWSDTFTTWLSTAAAGAAAENYQPIWYHGSHRGGFGERIGGFSSSMASTIASTIPTPPPSSSSSSSGFSSGGSSGGGGGGGGGGGW